jgi:hypothetical protein
MGFDPVTCSALTALMILVLLTVILRRCHQWHAKEVNMEQSKLSGSMLGTIGDLVKETTISVGAGCLSGVIQSTPKGCQR